MTLRLGSLCCQALLSGLMEILHRYWFCVWFSLAPRTFPMDNVGLEQTYQVKSTELRLTVTIVLLL